MHFSLRRVPPYLGKCLQLVKPYSDRGIHPLR